MDPHQSRNPHPLAWQVRVSEGDDVTNILCGDLLGGAIASAPAVVSQYSIKYGTGTPHHASPR